MGSAGIINFDRWQFCQPSYILTKSIPTNITIITIMSDVTYTNGYIYRLWSLFSDRVYVGSTHYPINERLINHRRLFIGGHNQTRATSLFMEVGVDNVQIELLASFTNITKELLEMHEQRWIDDSPNALNHNRAARKPSFELSKKDPESYVKHLFRMNGEQVESIPVSLTTAYKQQKAKEWYAANREKASEKSKAYYTANKDKSLLAQKARYQEKKQLILDAAKAKRDANKVFCMPCGKAYGNIRVHDLSKKHKINSGQYLITPLVANIENSNTPGYRRGLITPLVADSL